ncbi:MAG TPA: phytanoyl-CoA dioxygenase family protein [Chthonomonadaceae bacterium]|nr:phytanoyl-CoA dioxygenase family protein [Chthonomonadaceae bacterium]
MQDEAELTDAQWERYDRDGYLRLGRLLDEAELGDLQQRIDDIMLGRADVPYDRLLMQLDSTDGKYENAGPQSKGWKGETLAYRKIQELEHDPLFLAYMERPIFNEVCARIYGPDTPIASFRAMFMNKPAGQGTLLPWHQDRWNYLDRDPMVTMWTALDPATRENGCVQVIPGSHKFGLINPDHPSGFLTEEQAARFAPSSEIANLELPAGEAVLLHNWLLHRSDTNTTAIPRRAFSVCYIDGRTRASCGETYYALF